MPAAAGLLLDSKVRQGAGRADGGGTHDIDEKHRDLPQVLLLRGRLGSTQRRQLAWLESGITDLKQYLAGKPERVRELASLVKVTDVNQATLELFHARQKDELLKDLGQLLDEEDIAASRWRSWAS